MQDFWKFRSGHRLNGLKLASPQKKWRGRTSLRAHTFSTLSLRGIHFLKMSSIMDWVLWRPLVGRSFNCYSGEESALRYWKRHGCYPPGKNGPGPRPCPAPSGQSGPAALTDGPATRSRGCPAPALRREGPGWTSPPWTRSSARSPLEAPTRNPTGVPGVDSWCVFSGANTLQLRRSPLCTKAPWPEGKARLPSLRHPPTPHRA